jgi:hypothetical protein
VSLHHVELGVPDLTGSAESWSWLLGELGWTPFQEWPAGNSGAYLEHAWGYEGELAAGPP